MRDILIILGMIVAAIAIGAGLYFYVPSEVLAPAPSPAATTAPVSASNTPAVAKTVKFSELDSGTHAAGVSVRKNYAAYTEEDFAKIWKMAHGTDGKAQPKVDFSKEYVIGVFAGQKATGGNSIAVASVTDAGNARTVAVTITKPGAGCMVTESLTNPYQIIVVPVTGLSLAHTDTEVAKACK